MAPTLFDFQRKIRSGYSIFPRRKLPRPVRILNRVLVVLILVWGGYRLTNYIINHHQSPTGPKSSQSDTLGAATPADDGSMNGEETSSVNEGDDEDSGDTSPVLDPADTTTEVEAMAPAKGAVGKSTNNSQPGKYQKDAELGQKMDQLLHAYRPHAAFYLMVDAKSNEILAWGQRNDSVVQSEPTWLGRATFPAASLIKMVTSVAALESGHYGISTTIPLIGRSTTLYARQVRVPENYHGTTVTLEDAFAHSCNPVMGIIGKHVGAHTLKFIAQRFGFDRPFPNGMPQPSKFLPPDTGFGIAEVSSGFTRANTISPLHVAAIVRALVEQEPVQMPWSHTIPTNMAPHEPMPLDHSVFRAETYNGMRQLFQRTVTHGTARKHLNRTLHASNRDALTIGGKTGSLDGENPAGRYDWFAGFAQSKKDPQKAVIFVVMQVHVKVRTLPSSSIAGLLINTWAKTALGMPDRDQEHKRRRR